MCNSMGERCIPYALSQKICKSELMESMISSLDLVGLQLAVKMELSG